MQNKIYFDEVKIFINFVNQDLEAIKVKLQRSQNIDALSKKL